MADYSQQILSVFSFVLDLLTFFILACYHNTVAFFRNFIKPPLKSLAGEVVLITGGANGIGREVAFLLSKNCPKAKIVIWDMDERANKRIATDLEKLGCEIYVYKVDISKRLEVESAAQQVQNTVGDVTILINNAGIMPCKSFFKHSPQELERLFNINVFGNLWTLQTFVPKMISMNRGHVVTMCSAAGLIAVRNLTPYCGTKHAIQAIIEGLKDELRHMPNQPNIEFTTVYPYSCNTGLLHGLKSYSKYPWLVPTILSPQKVAEKVVDGLRRNYEHVYIPAFVQFAGIATRALAPKVQRTANDLLQCYVEPEK